MQGTTRQVVPLDTRDEMGLGARGVRQRQRKSDDSKRYFRLLCSLADGVLREDAISQGAMPCVTSFIVEMKPALRRLELPGAANGICFLPTRKGRAESRAT